MRDAKEPMRFRETLPYAEQHARPDSVELLSAEGMCPKVSRSELPSMLAFVADETGARELPTKASRATLDYCLSVWRGTAPPPLEEAVLLEAHTFADFWCDGAVQQTLLPELAKTVLRDATKFHDVLWQLMAEHQEDFLLRVAALGLGLPLDTTFAHGVRASLRGAWPTSVKALCDVAGASLKWARISPGSFVMGSPPSEVGRMDDRETPHEVTLTKPFWLKKAPVTQSEWLALMGYNPSQYRNDLPDRLAAECPVENVSWLDAVRFCNALSEREGLKPFYDIGEAKTSWDGKVLSAEVTSNPGEGEGYRLPSEAEWEYAARAGTSAAGYGDPEHIAWYGEVRGHTHPVGQKAPNAFGLYDMLGNVCEWTDSRYAPHSSEPQSDPNGPATGFERAVHGGSFSAQKTSLRAAFRFGLLESQRLGSLGFRPARTIVR